MPFYGKPTEFEEICSSLLVTKHPGVVSLQMQPAPVLLSSPSLGFPGVSMSRIVIFFVEHPMVQVPKDFFGYSYAEVICPSSNHWVELPESRLYLVALSLFPQSLEFRS